MAEEEYKRPSPEALLELAKAEEGKKRGKLTIYFGAAPGVGKTYAMLLDARQRKQEGIDVMVGYIETHGRPETEILLEGLEVIPPLVVEYMGIQLKEVNVEKVLMCKQKLVLVDEFAHTDAPGLRNTKRYQDIEEILNAGIDVYTTMNVQHIESLNDIVFQITNIRVRETVPDTVIETADEIKLVDLPPEELIKRLHEGKVYVKDMAMSAVHKFFRPGNLLALRQLALRAVAGSVDEKMRNYMQAHAIAGPWPAHERVLVGVFASPYADNLVRSAFRLAHELDAEWIALHVETEKNEKFSKEEKEWLNKSIELAKKLGARVVWVKGSDIAQEIADYAQKHNVTKIVMGKPRHFGRFYSLPRKILTKTPNIDIHLLDIKTGPLSLPKKRMTLSRPINYAVSILAVCIISLVAFPLRDILKEVNLLFLFLLPTTLSALYLGKGPSIVAAIVSIVLFDYLFVQPYFSFSVSDVEYFLSFIIYITVVVVIGNLASRLRNKVEQLRKSEAKSIALYGLSRDLVTAHTIDQILSILIRHIRQIFPCEITIFLPIDNALSVKAKTTGFEINPNVLGIASWVLINKQPAGQGTITFPQTKAFYLPMMTAENIIGVMGFIFEKNEQIKNPENIR